MTHQPGLAIFDLDYTITKRGTWGRFVWMNVRYRPHVWLPLLIAAGWTQWQYKRGNKPRVAVKQAMIRWAMKGRSKEKLVRLAQEFAKNEVPDNLRPGAIRALAAHRNAGDHVMMASAAVDIIVRPICDLLEIPHWVATDMGWDNDDRLKVEFASPNCYGPEKRRRVEAYLDANPELKQNNTIITIYSDSHSDLDLFQFGNVSVAVNPSAKLLKMSKSFGFRVEDWMI